MRVPLTGGPVPVLWIMDAVAEKWHFLPLPLGYAIWDMRAFWGHDGSRFWHAVPAPANGQDLRLPSAALLRAPAFHHTGPPLAMYVCLTSSAVHMQSPRPS